jgi:7-cyano-7-deazaguanine synthase
MQTVLIYSGGLDSTVLLAWLLRRGERISALSVDYGQRHRCELTAAQQVCARLGVSHRVTDLTALRPFLAGSSQTEPAVPVPHGHYADISMRVTVVPNRNMIMLAVALAWAISLKADTVAYAAHSGDHAIYPDCRPVFVAAMQQAAALCDWHPVAIETPFLHWTKAHIVQMGVDLAVPMHETWSCYEGGTVQCGQCGTCTERREAFQLAGVPDLTEYADVDTD